MKQSIIIICLTLFTAAQTKSQTAFTFSMITDTIGYGTPGGNDIVVQGDIINSGSGQVEVDIIRKENNMQAGWDSYLCADICLAPFADSMRVTIPSGQSQNFKLSFITSSTPATSNCLILFKNVGNSSSTVSKRLYGSTATAGLSEQGIENINVFPNPCTEMLIIKTNNVTDVHCIDALGRAIKLEFQQGDKETFLDVAALQNGSYQLFVRSNGKSWYSVFIKE